MQRLKGLQGAQEKIYYTTHVLEYSESIYSKIFIFAQLIQDKQQMTLQRLTTYRP